MAENSSSISLQFFEGAIWTAGRNLLQAVLSLVALAIVARELGPENYGVYGIAMLVIMVAEMLAGISLTEAIVQRKELNDGHIDATFWLSLIASITIGVLIAVFAELFAGLAGGTQAATVLTVLACLLPIRVGSAVPMALLTRDLHFRVKSQVGALATILSCGVGIALALGGAGIWTLVIMEAVSSTVNLVGAFLAVRWRPGWRGRWQHLREMAGFNASTLAAYAVGYADMLLPRILVSHLMGAQSLGVFMLATRVYSELAKLLTTPLASVAMAACARAQDARDDLHRMILGLYRTSRLIVFPACLGVAALAPYLVPSLFGPKWAAAVPAIQILMLGGLRLASGAFNTAILIGVGRVQSSLILFAAGCLLHVVLIPALAP
ncbi:MAG: oligosaccharide flippase family protein, partial [Porticoccaceae bacterium]